MCACSGTCPSAAAGWTCADRRDGLRGLLQREKARLVDNLEEGLPGCASALVCYETRGKLSQERVVCLHLLYIVSHKDRK